MIDSVSKAYKEQLSYQAMRAYLLNATPLAQSGLGLAQILWPRPDASRNSGKLALLWLAVVACKNVRFALSREAVPAACAGICCFAVKRHSSMARVLVLWSRQLAVCLRYII